MSGFYDEIKAAMDANGKLVSGYLASIGAMTEEGLEAFGKTMVQRLQEITSKPGTSQNMGPVNPRSVPGQPAAIQYGDYHGSWGYKVGHEAGMPYLDVGNSDPNAGFLEFGTRNMDPRPALRPTVDAMKNQLSAQIVDSIAKRGAAGVLGKLAEVVADGTVDL